MKHVIIISACGIKPAHIVGGSEVTPYSLPWQVGLVEKNQDAPYCGGTLISDRHVLTAAHCIVHGRSFDIVVGEHDVTSSSDGTRHEVCRSVQHPDYMTNSMVDNDSAIVHLNQPVLIGTRAAPACLPSASMAGDYLAGKTMTVSGWGMLTENGGIPTVLHKVDVPAMSNAECKTKYGSSTITKDMLCAGQPSGGIDACQGDSGGNISITKWPLM